MALSRLIGRSGERKQDVTDNLCYKLTTLLAYGQANFIMTIADANTLVVHLPSLRRHIGGRVTTGQLKAGIYKLARWGIVLSCQEAFDVMVVRMLQPSVFREGVAAGRPYANLPAFLELGLTPRKARLTEAAVSRMAKELSL